jgi:hypothetical protein
MSTALPTVMSKLVTVFDSAVDVTVYDGAPSTSANKQSFVAVGWDGDLDELMGEYAFVDQEWLYIGTTSKREVGQITCAAVAWSGDKTVGPRRETAIDLWSDCELALRTALATDPTWQSLVLGQSVLVSGGTLSQGQTSDGVSARLVFTVSYEAHI